ncbi:(pine wood nematode) hypothetical protein [Aphelenchoides besseyi]|nr:(pine wood nematode) hypothetical protein [Aphelenchoides besseyi]
MAVFVFVFIVLVVLFLFYHLFYKRLGLPPGPVPVPFLGNTLALNVSGRWEYQFLKWKKRYGKIFTYWVGELPIVAVNDYELCVKLFVHEADAFADRCAPEHFLRYTREGVVSGVIFTSNYLWQDQRRFALRVLKDFGFGGKALQDKILDEIRGVMENVNNEIATGQPEHDLHRQTDLAVGSVISSMLFGIKFNQDNKEEFYRLKSRTTQIIRSFTDPIIGVGRFNKHFFDATYFYCKSVIEAFADVYAFLDKQIQERLSHNDFTEDMHPRDYIDAFFIERAKLERTGGNAAAFYTVPQLKGMTFDLFFAGQETLSSTLTWIFAFLITSPQVQQKLHEELDREIDSDRLITAADKPKLHYLQAVIAVNEKRTFFSQNVLREASRDIKIDGLLIRKGTCIIPQISSIHYDPEVFDDPEAFKPERFIDDDGKFKKLDALIPFSLGKRVCLGETFARTQLFLFVANICNQYEVMEVLLPAKESPVLKRYPTAGANGMCPYKCRIRRRF